MRVLISFVVAAAVALGGLALDTHQAEAKSRKRVKQPAYSTSTNCLPKQLRYYLAETSKRFGKVVVISSFRRGAIIAGTRTRSKHASCQAVDFTVVKNQAAAARWLKTQPIEVITYSGGLHHIHIAVGSYKGHKGPGRYASKNRRKKRR